MILVSVVHRVLLHDFISWNYRHLNQWLWAHNGPWLRPPANCLPLCGHNEWPKTAIAMVRDIWRRKKPFPGQRGQKQQQWRRRASPTLGDLMVRSYQYAIVRWRMATLEKQPGIQMSDHEWSACLWGQDTVGVPWECRSLIYFIFLRFGIFGTLQFLKRVKKFIALQNPPFNRFDEYMRPMVAFQEEGFGNDKQHHCYKAHPPNQKSSTGSTIRPQHIKLLKGQNP